MSLVYLDGYPSAEEFRRMAREEVREVLWYAAVLETQALDRRDLVFEEMEVRRDFEAAHLAEHREMIRFVSRGIMAAVGPRPRPATAVPPSSAPLPPQQQQTQPTVPPQPSPSPQADWPQPPASAPQHMQAPAVPSDVPGPMRRKRGGRRVRRRAAAAAPYPHATQPSTLQFGKRYQFLCA